MNYTWIYYTTPVYDCYRLFERKWNMLLKARTEPQELRIWRCLNGRMELSSEEKQQYLNLKKGFEGECKFDTLIASQESKFLILHDLLLESNNNTFQIDSLLITEEMLIPFEVKNYEGDFYYQDDNFYTCSSNREITNPLHQLNRVETLLRQYLQKLGLHFSIKGFLVFIHAHFFLYQAPRNEKIIFSPQLDQLRKNLTSLPSRLSNQHQKLADLLIKGHISNYSHKKLPNYQYDWLKKGITCEVCLSFLTAISSRKMGCPKCRSHEKTEDAIVRSIEEFRLLFPKKKITTNIIYDWCKDVKSKKMIQRILKQNYKTIGRGQWSYYE